MPESCTSTRTTLPLCRREHLLVETNNLLKKEHYRTTLRIPVTNLTNKVALYNSLSTFSGTHFVEPRAYQASVGILF